MEVSKAKVCIIVGIPGVGKTTVLNLVEEYAGEEGFKIKIVNFGDKMFEEARGRGLVQHRDQIRRLPLTVQHELQEVAAKKIRWEAENSRDVHVFMVDTHSLVHTSTGYWPGLPDHVIKGLKPHTIFVVEARPEEVYGRRLRDSKIRIRGDEREIGEIREFMELARIAALSSAVLVGASVYIVKNFEGRAGDVAREIVKVLKML